MEKSNFSQADLIACGDGQLFNSDVRLPKNEMLMISRITNIDNHGGNFSKGIIKAEFDINSDLWFFGCHFTDDPVMPGCLGLDAMWQLLGFYLGWDGGEGKGRALGAKEIKFFGQVLPSSKTITYEIHIKRLLKIKLIMGLADGYMAVDGRPIYDAKDLKVGLFKDTSAF